MTTGLLSPKFHDEWGNLSDSQVCLQAAADRAASKHIDGSHTAAKR